MKIATAPINWNNEDVPGYRAPTPFPRILDEIVRAGYRATEWATSLPNDPEVLRTELERRQLTMLGAFVAMDLRSPEGRREEPERALATARFLRALGGRYLIAADAGDAARLAAAGHAEGAPTLDDGQLGRMARSLNELGHAVGAMGMELVFHPHVGTYVETPEEIDRLLSVTDPAAVGWCLDTGHQVYGGAELLPLVRAHRQRVRYVHLKDVDGRVLAEARAAGWSFHQALQRYVFCPLGTGLVPLGEVLGLIRDGGFDGWLVIEQDTTADDPTETAVRNRVHLEAILGDL